MEIKFLNYKGEEITNPMVGVSTNSPAFNGRYSIEKKLSISSTFNDYKYKIPSTGTVTVHALDGSNKKANCRVTVVRGISDWTGNVESGRSHYLANGTSLNLKTYFGEEYGKADGRIKKELEFNVIGQTGNFRVDKNGKVTALSDSGSIEIRFKFGDVYREPSITIYARPRYKKIMLKEDIPGYTGTNLKVGEAFHAVLVNENGLNLSDECKVEVSGNGAVVQKEEGQISILANKPGNYRVTFITTDGTNLRKSITLKVSASK